MARKSINKVVFAGVTLINLTNDTVSEGDVISGKQFHLPNGDVATGTYVPLDTSDATATADDIAYGKTAYVNGVKITGTRT